MVWLDVFRKEDFKLTQFMNFYRQLKKRKIELIVLVIVAMEFVFPQHVAAATIKDEQTSIMLPKLTYTAASPAEDVATENGRIVLITVEGEKKLAPKATVSAPKAEEKSDKNLASAAKAYN